MGLGLPYPSALAAVFLAACLFLLLSVTGLRSRLLRLFPEGVKESIGPGLGLFLAFVSFQSSQGMGICTAHPSTLVCLNSLSPNNYDAYKIYLSLVVLGLTAALLVARIPGAALVGILFGTVVCWLEGWTRGEASLLAYPFQGNRTNFHLYVPDRLVSAPSFGLSGAVWGGFQAAVDPDVMVSFWTAVATLCFTDLLDATGTFFAVARVAGLTENGDLVNQDMAYLADALAALFGSFCGVSTVATYGESAVAVADGARTGLASFVTGCCFALALPFAPLLSCIPPLASAPILCLMGAMMCSSLRRIDWENLEEAIPAFLVLITMPFTFSVGYGHSVHPRTLHPRDVSKLLGSEHTNSSDSQELASRQKVRISNSVRYPRWFGLLASFAALLDALAS